ncbi:hypothetical protein DFH08DRAFT_974126 [Mycena albidolilacea]|uniref:Mid2 domain-containing protein n=1 Tax=Mycena albidolilacea TaxID=1033008 RepID=A0AAD6Z7J0_9AGAR|nr:hypothetical protein DFH08DRAFT_974126 [Mycena albidolilacea]
MILFSGAIALVIHALLASSPCTQAYAALTTITIDDSNSTFWTWETTPDDIDSSWHAITPTTPCSAANCVSGVDPAQVTDATWHDGHLSSGSCKFQGSAISIYGIEVINPANISFTMDDPATKTFHYFDTRGGFVYNALFFEATNLDPNVQHTVKWVLEASSVDGGSALFDYALVTVDQPDTTGSAPGTPTSSPPGTISSGVSPSPPTSSTSSPTPHKSKTGLIVGSVVGVVGALAIVGAILVFLRRRKSSADGPGFLVEPYQPSMAVLAPASVSAPASMSPPPSTASASKRSDPVVSAWDPNPQPTDASGRDPGVEERLRHLESLVGASALRGSSASPPAYGQ